MSIRVGKEALDEPFGRMRRIIAGWKPLRPVRPVKRMPKVPRLRRVR
jgi:hypothetical protein